MLSSIFKLPQKSSDCDCKSNRPGKLLLDLNPAQAGLRHAQAHRARYTLLSLFLAPRYRVVVCKTLLPNVLNDRMFDTGSNP